ncbi:hypothetical protein [Actinoplanes couchii]|uniref:Uncharacterized protein n=1 Tax=Actinoplanes couchii TaxID=403638 RepID=A0ABQ3XT76_9ACTN|nr:hypothetical protein [Actinoplanes couchii]MDR6324109.1 hypothetical protein [Actinoplanes couchii]GID61635.1 hypothetical protein Aco03nite_100390 [Actinoplanes couchii]
MRSMSMLQIIGGVAAAGVVAAGTSALTATGVSFAGTGTGTATQYVGGQVTQTVSGGASITAVNYTTSPGGDQITAIQVSVANANGAYLQVTPGGGSLTTANEWYCTGDVAASVGHATAPKVHLNAGPATVSCITADSASAHAAAGYYSGLTSVQLDVTNS